jgi:hypothetical protein
VSYESLLQNPESKKMVKTVYKALADLEENQDLDFKTVKLLCAAYIVQKLQGRKHASSKRNGSKRPRNVKRKVQA